MRAGETHSTTGTNVNFINAFRLLQYGNLTAYPLMDGLKEDAHVDIATAMTPTQLVIIWVLLGCLFAWMILFTFLALRPAPETRKHAEAAEVATKSLPSTPISFKAAPKMLHAVATPVETNSAHLTYETPVMVEQSQSSR